jgi:hypothetical protein
MALFWFIVCAGIVGLSVDTANAWRQKERLQLTADVASHAGILVVLAGGSEADVRLATRNSVLSNMPNAGFGRVINADLKDIVLSEYDNSNDRVAAPTTVEDIDAVTVQLHRDDVVDNPVGTYLLQFVGFPSWQVTSYGTTVLIDFENCPNYEGIWAHGYINSNDDNLFGPEFCVHSQDQVQLPQDTTWEDGSYLGMPSLKKCLDDGKCDDTANFGVEDAMHEINLQMPSFDDIILEAYSDMIAQDTDSDGNLLLNDRQEAFWDSKGLDTDELAAAWDDLFGTTTPGPGEPSYVPPELGTVVELTVAEFEAIDNPPSGLTYNVRCNPNGNGVNTYLDMLPTASGAAVDDLVVLTNCSVDFHDDSDWRGVMVVSTRERANATLRASAGAIVGDPNKTCDPTLQSYIFARSDMNVAAEFAASNTIFMSGGDVTIASGTSGEVDHYGMTVYADGNVKLTTNHNYYACGIRPPEIIIGIPNFEYIKQVMPTNEADRIAEFN